MTDSNIIAQYTPTLQLIAYRILGSFADAEDMVQDALVKWMTIDTSKVKDAKAFLIKSVTNNCLNLLSKKKAVSDMDETAIDELVNAEESQPLFDLENQLNEAWKVLHHKLEPLEKKVYLLREVFNLDYEVVQELCNKKADNCRKILSRAKLKLQVDMPKVSLPSVKVPKSFMTACRFGNLNALIAELKKEISGDA